MEKTKFLVLNPSESNLETIIDKVNVQESKNGPFEAILLLGDVLSEDITLPQHTFDKPAYFSKGKKPMTKEINVDDSKELNEISKNLIYVSSNISVLKLSSGITMVFAVDTDDIDRNKLESISGKVDILITYSWPAAIASKSNDTSKANLLVDEMINKLKPRYHFAVGDDEGKFLEYEPFQWENETVTRFISLAKEGTGSKWFYAFNISSVQTEVDFKLYENPFISKKRPITESSSSSSSSSHTVTKKPKVVTPNQCFFCLSNPNVETHMIVAIGNSSYVTIAKGPLTRSNRNIPFSGHGIIIPIDHIPVIKDKQSPMTLEMDSFQNKLVTAFNKVYPSLTMVFFEISLSTNVHFHRQFLPIDKEFLQNNNFETVLNDKAKYNNENFSQNHNLEFTKFDSQEDIPKQKLESQYVMFILCEEDGFKYYISTISDDSTKKFDLQFPRRVLSYILKSPKRLYWEKCQQPKIKEDKDCQEFKTFFSPFNI